MEDLLEVYSRPRDERRPVVCLDELCKQLIADVRETRPALPGMGARVDYEYERRGMCSAFMVYAPIEQWRGVRVTGQRTAVHWAETIKWLCDEVYPPGRAHRPTAPYVYSSRRANKSAVGKA